MTDYRIMNPITLAFMGDAVYEQYIREQLIRENRVPSGRADQLHKAAVHYVCAGAQAEIVKSLINDGVLTESEKALVRRARNHKSATKPKNAGALEYKWATAFEALIGYLFLSEETQRLKEILDYAWCQGDGSV